MMVDSVLGASDKAVKETRMVFHLADFTAK